MAARKRVESVPIPRPLTLPEVAAAAELEYATLHSWLKKQLIVPSVQISTGTGRPNLFSERDLLTIKALADLRRVGIDFARLAQAASELQEPADLSGEEVLVVNGRVALADGKQPLDDVVSRSEPTTLYHVAIARDTVESVRLSEHATS